MRKSPLHMEPIEMGGMFPFTTIVVYRKGASIEKVIEEAAQQDDNLKPLAEDMQSGATSLSLVFKHDGTTVAYMIVDDNISIDTIVHEAIHIVCRLFEIIGSYINEETEEFFAYLNAHIFREVYKVVTRKFKLKPKMIHEEG